MSLPAGSKVTLQHSGREAVLQTPGLIVQLANVLKQHPDSMVLSSCALLQSQLAHGSLECRHLSSEYTLSWAI